MTRRRRSASRSAEVAFHTPQIPAEDLDKPPAKITPAGKELAIPRGEREDDDPGFDEALRRMLERH